MSEWSICDIMHDIFLMKTKLDMNKMKNCKERTSLKLAFI